MNYSIRNSDEQMQVLNTDQWRRQRRLQDPLRVDHPCRGTCHSEHTSPVLTSLPAYITHYTSTQPSYNSSTGY